ncbi:MAG: hypothetical protein ABIA63_07645 [bacterium]
MPNFPHQTFACTYHHRNMAYRFYFSRPLNKTGKVLHNTITSTITVAVMLNKEKLEKLIHSPAGSNELISNTRIKDVYLNPKIFTHIYSILFRNYSKKLSFSMVPVPQKPYLLVLNCEEIIWMEKMPKLISLYDMLCVLSEVLYKHHREIAKQKTIMLPKQIETFTVRLKNTLEEITNLFLGLSPLDSQLIKVNKFCYALMVYLKRIGLTSIADGCSLNIEHSKLAGEYIIIVEKLWKYIELLSATPLFRIFKENAEKLKRTFEAS